jgi:pantothenate kinase-related protein Tda10
MPMMIATSDYVLIIEELYAASAQASGDPVAMNFLAAQDAGKAILMAILVIGLIFAAMGSSALIDLLGYAA